MGIGLGTVLGGVGGFLLGGPAGAIAGASLGGGLDAADSAERAAGTSADAQLAAARIAAEEARFRPVGITTRFGQSTFGFDEAGRLKEAGYTLDPQLAALQSRLLGVTPQALETALGAGAEVAPVRQAATGLFGLGQQFLPTDISRQASPEAMAQAQRLYGLAGQVTPTAYDPTAAAQSYYNEAQAMLDPSRQRQEQRLGASVFGRGRAGLNISGQGQPELFALGQAREEQNMALAAQARERARQELRQDIGLGSELGLAGLQTQQRAEELARARLAEDLRLGTGLFGTGLSLLGDIPAYQTAAMSPFKTQLGLAQTIEELGQQPLDIGAQLGGRAATAGSAAGQALLKGGLDAASTRLGGQQVALGTQYGAFRDVLGQLQRPGMFDSARAAFGGTSLGQSGFGTGLAYGSQDYGQYL
jgi:hypothetical protein